MINARRSPTVLGSVYKYNIMPVLLPGTVSNLFACVANLFMRLVLHFSTCRCGDYELSVHDHWY